MPRLSKETVSSFVGNVLPLSLVGVRDDEVVTWESAGDCLTLTAFDKEQEPFYGGVLITLTAPGTGSVTARYGNAAFTCTISARARRHAEPSRDLQYYLGDLHDHTHRDHNPVTFKQREPQHYPRAYLEQVKEEGLLDFCVVSDHACLLNAREFFRGFEDDEATEPKDLIVFPGSEAEVTARETDRYGVVHKCSGEAVTLNTGVWPNVDSFDKYFAQVEKHPFTVAAFAHPQIVGYSTPGVWNFCFEKNNTPRFLDLFRLIETGDGSTRESNLINEYAYSVALDNGFHVSPTCSSDSHGPHWGYWRFPGKTVIMAQEKSKEAFLDAILHNRVYATASGNVKLYYEVNGAPAPATLSPANAYHFAVSVSYFQKRLPDEIRRCQVISDGGMCLFETDCTGQSEFSFDVCSDTAHYFYLVLSDYYGRKTWSCPVWTGRPFAKAERPPLAPLSKKGFTAVDEVSGKDASVLLCDDPHRAFRSEKPTCSIVIDMHRVEKIAAISHYPKILYRSELAAEGLDVAQRIAFFPSLYRLSTSLNGADYTLQKEGRFRVFGGEEFITFAETEARFVKLEIPTNVGREFLKKKSPFFNALVDMAELTVWQKTE